MSKKTLHKNSNQSLTTWNVFLKDKTIYTFDKRGLIYAIF